MILPHRFASGGPAASDPGGPWSQGAGKARYNFKFGPRGMTPVAMEWEGA